jgi:hypothetical protein
MKCSGLPLASQANEFNVEPIFETVNFRQVFPFFSGDVWAVQDVGQTGGDTTIQR